MLRPVILLFLLLIQYTTWEESSAEILYAISEAHIDDSERWWTVAPHENRWDIQDVVDSEQLGLLFAGKSEFPYVVHISIIGGGEDTVATGSLVSTSLVLTTCRAVDMLGIIDREGVIDSIPAVIFTRNWIFEFSSPGLIPDEVLTHWVLSGARNVFEAVKLARCDIQNSLWDGGMIFLTTDIVLSPPYINVIQVGINYNTGLLGDFELSQMGGQRRLCYIASFGHKYRNLNFVNMVEDYKVKYRVYWESPDLCNQYQDKMCPNRDFPADCTRNEVNVAGRELMCFKSRGKVGTVCDHDKGAPLVCDGTVFGMVHLAAKQQYCNSLFALPFWVQKTTVVEEYFQPVVDELPGNRDAGKREKTRTIGAAFNGISSADSLINRYSIPRLLPLLLTVSVKFATASFLSTACQIQSS